jgi:hypothetical protein
MAAFVVLHHPLWLQRKAKVKESTRCRFCEQDKVALVKAHVIPRSFFRRVRGDAKYSTELSASKEAVKETALQAGNYDCEILCKECEQIFSPYDKQGYSVFTKVFEEPNIYRDRGIECAHVLPDVDFPLLKLFVLSVLWRASVSRMRFYRDVDLGQPHEDKIKSLIASGTIEDADDYEFFCCYQKENPYPKAIQPPRNRRATDGINYVRLYLPDIQIVVKVDKRPLPDVLSKFVLTPKPPHYIVRFPYKGSDEAAYFDGMKAAMRAHRTTKD